MNRRPAEELVTARSAKIARWLAASTAILAGAALIGRVAIGASGADEASGTGSIEHGPSASACIKCHAEAHPGFATSGHALAHVEPWYARSFALTPEDLKPLCVRCHAPTRPDAGVTCETCHVDGGGGPVLVPHDRPLARAPHATRFAPELRNGALCARCHVVDLPLGKDGAWVRLQDTPAEHALWRARTGDARGCVDCHAGPAAGAHFAGVRDPATLARAVRLAVPQVGLDAATARIAGTVRLENLAGHAFPAGSQLREALVRVDIVAPDGRRATLLRERLSIRGDPAEGEPLVDRRLEPGETRALAFAGALPEGFPSAGLAVEATVDLALVSLDYPDGHPMIPPGEPRMLPVASARVELR
jgi:hypothetical protein